MRETIVTELWAHGLDDLARLACEVDAATILAVIERTSLNATEDRLAGTSLARAAIEVMTRIPETRPLVRSRSPILEMPNDLRYAAHRADTLDTMAQALDGVRHRRGRWAWLVLEARDLPHYVQFSSWPGPGMCAEAIGASNLGAAYRGAVDEDQLTRLGWKPPSNEDTAGNWVRRYRSPGREDLRAIATNAIETLELAYGVGPPARFDLEGGSWSDADLPPAVR